MAAAMTTVIGAAPLRRTGYGARPGDSSGGSIATGRDYLYVLPALGVMFLVIGYPIYYTVYLSFFNTPPSLADGRQDLRRPRELRAYSVAATAFVKSRSTR